MRRLTLVLVFVLALSFIALAQDFPRAEVNVGYAYQRAQTGTVTSFNAVNMSGVGTGVTFNFKPAFGLVADFAYQKTTTKGQTDNKMTTVLFGPQFTYRGESKLSPFARGYIGYVHASPTFFGMTTGSDTEKAWGMGAGMDAHLSRYFSARLFQVDYVRTHFNRTHQNNVRLRFGLVFKLGEKAK